MGIASAVTAWLFYLQFQNSPANPVPYMGWGFGIFSLGTFLGVRAFGIRERRVFETTEVLYTHAQRLKRAARWFVPGVVLLAFVWCVQLSSDQFSTYWWYAWPALFPIAVGVGLYVLRKEQVLSAAAQHGMAQLQAARQHAKLERNTRLEAAWDSAPVRYLIAAAALYGSYYYAFEDTSGKAAGWLPVGLLILAMIFARELALWLLGFGVVCLVGWALFAGLAALPVSVAVIIGALIIAGACGRK
jgi:hypothetical protein